MLASVVLWRPLCLWWLPRNTQPKINIEQNFRLGCLFWPYTSIYQHGARRAPIPAFRFSAHVLVLAGLWFANLLFRRNPGVEPRRHRPGFYLGSGSPPPGARDHPETIYLHLSRIRPNLWDHMLTVKQAGRERAACHDSSSRFPQCLFPTLFSGFGSVALTMTVPLPLQEEWRKGMRNNGEAAGSSVVNDNKCLLQLFWDQNWQKSIERETVRTDSGSSSTGGARVGN